MMQAAARWHLAVSVAHSNLKRLCYTWCLGCGIVDTIFICRIIDTEAESLMPEPSVARACFLHTAAAVKDPKRRTGSSVHQGKHLKRSAMARDSKPRSMVRRARPVVVGVYLMQYRTGIGR